jgi:hypothetical protein
MMHRLRRNADRNIGFTATLSARALNVEETSLAVFFHQDGMSPQRIGTSAGPSVDGITTSMVRAPADDCVKRSLFERAVGYYVDAEKIFHDREGNVVRVQTKEYIAPSDKAQELWLTNRLPDEWKSRQEVKHSGGVVNLNVTAEDLLL